MAILKYKLVAREEQPWYIFDLPSFRHPTEISSDPQTFWAVGIGLGGGTLLTHAELLTFVQEIHTIHPFMTQVDPDARDNPIEMRDMTDAEVETMVSDWCIEKAHTNPDGR
jgi:hypothetical protein